MKKTHKILKTIGTLLLIVISGCSSGDSESGDFYSKDNSYFLSVQKDEVIWREEMFGVTAKASAGNINFTITQSGKTLEAKLETKDGSRKQLKAIWLKEKNVWVVLQINDSPLNIVLRIKDDWENAEEDEIVLQSESVAMNHTTPAPKKENPESVNSNFKIDKDVTHSVEESKTKNSELITQNKNQGHERYNSGGFYVINVAAANTEQQAKNKMHELNNAGYQAGYLWIPDYASLSGAQLFCVYIGPFKTQYECEVATENYRKKDSKAYGLFVSNESTRRVQIMGIGKVSVR